MILARASSVKSSTVKSSTVRHKLDLGAVVAVCWKGDDRGPRATAVTQSVGPPETKLMHLTS